MFKVVVAIREHGAKKKKSMFWFHSWRQKKIEVDWKSFSQVVIRRFIHGDENFMDLE